MKVAEIVPNALGSIFNALTYSTMIMEDVLCVYLQWLSDFDNHLSFHPGAGYAQNAQKWLQDKISEIVPNGLGMVSSLLTCSTMTK